MNNKKLMKVFEELKNENLILQDNLNRVINAFTGQIKGVHSTLHEILLNVDSILNLLKLKGIITEDELKAEITKLHKELKEKSIEIQKKVESPNTFKQEYSEENKLDEDMTGDERPSMADSTITKL
jgi:predicted methyltransferase